MRHSTRFIVNLEKLHHNVTEIGRIAPNAKIMAMVKANAYGHGLVPISKFLLTSVKGIDRVGVATMGEAQALVNAFKEQKDWRHFQKKTIVVTSECNLRGAGANAFYTGSGIRIIPVLSNKEDVKMYCKAKEWHSVPLWIKIDTGLHRLGLKVEDVKSVLPLLRKTRYGVHHLMQHFSLAKETGRQADTATSRQYRHFREVQSLIQADGVQIEETSTSGSGGILRGYSDSWIRPGRILYCACGLPHEWRGKTIGTLETTILKVSYADAGDALGYGNFPVAKKSLVAVLAIGYADGFLRYYRHFPVNIEGIVGYVHGNVSMDLTIVVFTPDKNCSMDDIARVVRPHRRVQLWAEFLSEHCKIEACERMASISARVPREYIY